MNRLLVPPGVAGILSTDPAELLTYARASGPIWSLPAAVARPRQLSDVVSLVQWAERDGVSLIARGAGTGMPGGNVGPGVIVDLSAFDALGEVTRADGSAQVTVGAGVVAARVQEAARAVGFFLPPLPSSADRCTIGGMVANNASGARTFRYGSIRDWVTEVEVTLTGGEVVHLRSGQTTERIAHLHRELQGTHPDVLRSWPRVRKNSSGYALDRFLPSTDPVQLLVGSEGTLGIVTGVTLRLAPLPAARGVSLFALPRTQDLTGLSAAAEALGASACEVFGRRLMVMAGLEHDVRVGGLAQGAAFLVLLELEGTPEAVERKLEEARALARGAGSATLEATDPGEAHRLWELRHRASPTIARSAERGLHSTQFIEDSVVPPGRLSEYVDGVGELLKAEGTDAVVFGHAGDGNVHVNPLVDVHRPAWKDEVRRVLDGTAELVRHLGGTLSGEHGDGRVRAPYLATVWPDDCVAAFQGVKRALDPSGIFNPGVILPLPGQDPLEGLNPARNLP